ncbi:co-chaperone GroES [Candidatus Pacearchaeota archaeon CG10_big_fil_rev_8_21_14_0_10_31_24]|nr:MAG: co-chaperone GroES [Candidatus Pacearchaeota archaeon CG10_big_fil_rev_8_21_14_0_10_31_24]
MKITPLGERVLIEQVFQTEERTKSGLYIPKSNEEKKEGIVISVGTLNNGQPIPLKMGDKVIYGGYTSEEIEIEGKKHLIVELKDIVARIE